MKNFILKQDDDTSEIPDAVKKRKEMTRIRYQLRKLRNKIYARIYSCQSVLRHLKKYHSLTENFIVNFNDELSVEDVAILESS